MFVTLYMYISDYKPTFLEKWLQIKRLNVCWGKMSAGLIIWCSKLVAYFIFQKQKQKEIPTIYFMHVWAEFACPEMALIVFQPPNHDIP